MSARKLYHVVALLMVGVSCLCGSAPALASVVTACAMDTVEGLPLRVLPQRVDSLKPLRTDTVVPVTEGADTMFTALPADAGRLPHSLLRRERGATLGSDSTEVTAYTDSLQHAVTDSLEMLRLNSFKPDPIRAMWLGMVFPGGGQIYNRKYWKLPLIYGGVLGCIYAVSWNSQMLRDYSQAYQDISDSDPTTTSYLEMLPLGYDITGREEHFKSVFKRKKDFYRRFRDLSIFCIAGVYLLSIVDAYVDAELSTFDIGTDLSLNIAPTVIPSEANGVPELAGSSPGIKFLLIY